MAIDIFISPAIALARDAMTFAWRKLKKPDPIETVEKRKKLKSEFEANMRWIDKSGRYGEAIIRDVKHVDEYPNINAKSKGISSWFKVTLVGVYHRGIQVGLTFYSLKYCQKEKSWHITADYESRDINAILIGRIPYDRIITIDWTGDEYYYSPHIYCLFTGWRPSPYEELVLSEEHISDYPQTHSWYEDLVSYSEARKLTKIYEPSYFT